MIARVHGLATAAGCQLVAQLRPRGGRQRRALRDLGDQRRTLLRDARRSPLSRNVSRKRAFEMLMTGEFIDAETARDWGLVNRVVPVGRSSTAEVARAGARDRRPSRASPSETGKRMFYRQLEMTLDEATAYAAEVMARNMLAEDAGEGIDAFLGEARTGLEGALRAAQRLRARAAGGRARAARGPAARAVPGSGTSVSWKRTKIPSVDGSRRPAPG